MRILSEIRNQLTGKLLDILLLIIQQFLDISLLIIQTDTEAVVSNILNVEISKSSVIREHA